jgi:hypothetical protein
MSKAKIQGNFCDEVATQTKKHLQLAEEKFKSLFPTNESCNEIFVIITLLSKFLLQKYPAALSSILCSSITGLIQYFFLLILTETF